MRAYIEKISAHVRTHTREIAASNEWYSGTSGTGTLSSLKSLHFSVPLRTTVPLGSNKLGKKGTYMRAYIEYAYNARTRERVCVRAR